MTLTETVHTREGFTHSFPVLKLPAESCWLFTSEDKAAAIDVLNVLFADGFEAHLGRSEKIEVAAAVCVRWSVFVDGDRETVAAARECLRQWREGV